jgi:hypothetical protein
MREIGVGRSRRRVVIGGQIKENVVIREGRPEFRVDFENLPWLKVGKTGEIKVLKRRRRVLWIYGGKEWKGRKDKVIIVSGK